MSHRVGYIVVLVCLWSSAIAQINQKIIGRNVAWKTLSDGNTVRMFGFADNISEYPDVPGVTMEMIEGDTFVIDFWNISQGAPHTIHLHGLDVNQANDGVPHLSFEVHHMEHGFYRFRAPKAGTYLYHCHVVSSIHVQAGMYGLIVVHPPSGEGKTWENGYVAHRDHRLMFSEIDTVWHNDTVLIHEYDTNSHVHHVPIPEYHPQHFLVNGLSQHQLIDEVQITGQALENVYVRLANIGYLMNRIIIPPAMKGRLVSSDGRPFSVAEVTDTIEVFPGERFGLLCQPTTEFESAITVQYVNLNTNEVMGEEEVAIIIDGSLGLDELSTTRVSLFPSPTNDELNIAFEKVLDGIVQASILNEEGRLVRELSLVGIQTSVDVAELAAGVYFIHFKSTSERWVQRFVKE